MDHLVAPDFQAFVLAHARDDVARLLLGPIPPGIDRRAAAEQIRARQQARARLPAWCAAPGVVFPPPLSVEQASSSATAAYKAGLVAGARIVDLTGGMGVDALAFAATGSTVTYVERDAELCARFAHNARLLTTTPIRVVNDDAAVFAAGLPSAAADVVYLDPARRDEARRRVVLFEDCSPNLLELLPVLRERVGRMLIKASPMMDIAEACRTLGEVRAVHVVAVANACRELLFLCERGFAGVPEISCANQLRSGAWQTFRFTFAAEAAAANRFAEPGRYLYDPNTAIRKAGAFRLVGQAFGLDKLAPATHLYTADRLVAGFPGRVFELTGIADPKARRPVADGRANVVVRNHPDTAERLRARYRLADGGDAYLFGVRDRAGRPRLLLARRIPG